MSRDSQFHKVVLGRIEKKDWYTFFAKWMGKEARDFNLVDELRSLMVDRYLCHLQGGEGKWVDGKLWMQVDCLVDDILGLVEGETEFCDKREEVCEIIATFIALGWMEGRPKKKRKEMV